MGGRVTCCVKAPEGHESFQGRCQKHFCASCAGTLRGPLAICLVDKLLGRLFRDRLPPRPPSNSEGTRSWVSCGSILAATVRGKAGGPWVAPCPRPRAPPRAGRWWRRRVKKPFERWSSAPAGRRCTTRRCTTRRSCSCRTARALPGGSQRRDACRSWSPPTGTQGGPWPPPPPLPLRTRIKRRSGSRAPAESRPPTDR